MLSRLGALKAAAPTLNAVSRKTAFGTAYQARLGSTGALFPKLCRIGCLVLLVIFLVEVAITHIVSLGSIIIAALYPVLTLCYWLWKGADAASLVFITVCCVLMGAYVIWLHRSNIQRLKNGTEYRFGEKKKENQ